MIQEMCVVEPYKVDRASNATKKYKKRKGSLERNGRVPSTIYVLEPFCGLLFGY